MEHLQSGSLLPHAGTSRIVGGSIDPNPQSAIRNPQFVDWRVYVMSVWLLGMTALAVFLAVRLRSLSRGCGETSEAPSVPESFYNRMRQCASRVGLRRLPRVVSTARLSNPAVFGMFRPILLMPVGYLRRLSRTDTEHVLLHEFCHIKRGDLFVHGFTLCLQVVYWFNPLLWLVRRRIHHLRELCCDGSVANLLREDTLAYRETLLETARRFLVAQGEPGLGLLGLFEDSNCLLMRVRWLEKPTWRYRKKKQGQERVRKLLLERNIDVVDEMICQGGFLFVGLGHPNQTDINEVIGYANRMIKRVDK
jgi:beta-lactamase regulating signal transducer with metallopeptidase domain